MSQDGHDYDEILRRALHEAAGTVQLGDDGLERIRAHLTKPHSIPIAWLLAACSAVARLLRRLLQSAVEPVWLAAGRLRQAAGGAGPPASQPGRHRRGRMLPQLSLTTVAVAVVAVLAIAGGLALTSLPGQAIKDTAQLIREITETAPSHSTASGHPGGQGPGVPPGGSGTGGSGTGGSASHGASPSPTPCTSQAAGQTGSIPRMPRCQRPARSSSPVAQLSPSSSTSPGGSVPGLVSPPASPGSPDCPSPTAAPSTSTSPSPGASPSPAGAPGPGASASPCPSPSSASPSPTGSATPPARRRAKPARQRNSVRQRNPARGHHPARRRYPVRRRYPARQPKPASRR